MPAHPLLEGRVFWNSVLLVPGGVDCQDIIRISARIERIICQVVSMLLTSCEKLRDPLPYECNVCNA